MRCHCFLLCSCITFTIHNIPPRNTIRPHAYKERAASWRHIEVISVVIKCPNTLHNLRDNTLPQNNAQQIKQIYGTILQVLNAFFCIILLNNTARYYNLLLWRHIHTMTMELPYMVSIALIQVLGPSPRLPVTNSLTTSGTSLWPLYVIVLTRIYN